MAAVEVNSFVSKFLALWTNGKKVSLKLNAENGKANLTMELDLGDDGQRSPLNNDTTHFENYRQRRRYRRSNDKSEVDEKIETSSACVKKSPVATKIESNLQDDILENIPEVKEEVVYNYSVSSWSQFLHFSLLLLHGKKVRCPRNFTLGIKGLVHL